MANELNKVIINGQEFELYTDIFSLDTMTWTKEPTRSLDGSMPDINDIDRFPVPRLWIDFKYISIDDYRRLLSAVNAPEFEVTYYNLETDSMVTHNMYIHPLDRYKIHNKGKDLIGIIGAGITLVGTLNEVLTYSITYNGNGASGGQISTQTGVYGTLFVISEQGTLVKEGNVLTSWNTQGDGLGVSYAIGQKVVLTGNITLYAQWEKIEIPQEPIMQIITATTLDVTTLIEHDIDEYWTAVMLFIKRAADVAVTWQNVDSWYYNEIAILPLGKIQKVLIETDGTVYRCTAGDYFEEIT